MYYNKFAYFALFQIKDLLSFGIILVVVTTAFGLAQQAIMFPNEPSSAALIFETLKIAYYQMYGELFLDDIEGNSSFFISFLAAVFELRRSE